MIDNDSYEKHLNEAINNKFGRDFKIDKHTMSFIEKETVKYLSKNLDISVKLKNKKGVVYVDARVKASPSLKTTIAKYENVLEKRSDCHI